MIRNIIKLSVLTLTMSICVACATQKGSSSLGVSNTSTSATPRIKSDELLKAQAQAAEDAAIKAKQQAETQAKQQAEVFSKNLTIQKEATKKKTYEEAVKIQQSANEKVESTIDAIEDKTITVREESVKIIETQGEEATGKYHIIIGTFKVLENAHTTSEQALTNGFNPSIMENEEGLYRVSIYSCDLEKTARRKISEIRTKYPEYVGVWLLIVKN